MGIELNDEDLDKHIVLTDENGEDAVFEFLDYIENGGKEYAVLHPVNDEKGEVVILRIEGIGDDETYTGVETEEEARRIFNIFIRRGARRDSV